MPPSPKSQEGIAVAGSPEYGMSSAETASAPERKNKLMARMGYFMVYGGLSTCKPYYILLLKEKRFSERTAGYMIGLLPLSSLLALSPLALAADRFHCAKAIIFGGGAMTCLSFVVLVVTPNPSTAFTTLVLLLHFLGICPIFPFFDNRVLSTLPEERRKEWGSMRCFGSFGWGICSVVSYTLKGYFGWWVSALFLMVGVGGAMGCYEQIEPLTTPLPTRRNLLGVVQYVAQHRRTVLFLLATCLSGFAYTLGSTFLPSFLESLQASSLLLGLTVTMTVVAEIPIFHYAGYIHSRVSDRNLLVLSLLGWSLRALCYAALYKPWLVLLIEPLHGLSFGCMWLSGIHYLTQAFPTNLSHSAIGFLSATVFGIGPVVGNTLGGEMYEAWGPRQMYGCMSLLVAVSAALFYIVDRQFEGDQLVESHEIFIESAQDASGITDQQSPAG